MMSPTNEEDPFLQVQQYVHISLALEYTPILTVK